VRRWWGGWSGSALAICASLALIAIRVRADDTAQESVRIQYEAASGCPSADAFVAAVSARTTRMRIATVSERARTFHVMLANSARGIDGRVTIRDVESRERHRDVSGVSCAEVADVLALVVALAIDPAAIVAPRASTTPPPSAIPVPALSTAVLAAPSTNGVVSSPPDTRAAAVREALPSSPPAAGWRWALGAGAVVGTGVTPATLIGPDVFVELRSRATAWSAPAFRLSLQRTSSSTLEEPGGTAHFVWTVVRADACVQAWRPPASRFAFDTCARVEAGALEARGGGVAHAKSTASPWLGAGPAARARLRLVGTLFVDAEIALRFAIAHDRFYFEPDATFYEVPIVGATFGAGMGASF
jgi:hypothetical protein